MTEPPAPSAGLFRGLTGHPRGLYVLIATETWAWFSYFGMQALLIFYMTKHLHFPQPKASAIYGTYTALAFFTPLFGGFLADRLLGQRRSIVLGGTLMAAGHFMMIWETMFYPALGLIVLGNGAFVPTLIAQVARLYPENDPRCDRAYSLYYVGVNVGSFLAPLICGTLGERLGWHYGFAAAGIGMGIGLAIYTLGRRSLPPNARIRRSKGISPIRLTAADWQAVRLLIGVALLVVLFRIAYEQSGNTIALWIDADTDRRLGSFLIPATWFQSINPALIILGTPFLTAYWTRQAVRGNEPDTLRKMAIGCGLAGCAYLVLVWASLAHGDGELVHWSWTVAYFTLLTAGELYILPIGLSLFSRIAPVQAASIMIGVWYLAKFVGSLAAGWIGSWWSALHPSAFFLIGASFAFVAALAMRLAEPFAARARPQLP